MYAVAKAAGVSSDNVEVVFVSSDRDEGSFDAYRREMPWVALPFSDRARKKALSAQFGVRGIPTLVVLDGATGQLVTSEGRARAQEFFSGSAVAPAAAAPTAAAGGHGAAVAEVDEALSVVEGDALAAMLLDDSVVADEESGANRQLGVAFLYEVAQGRVGLKLLGEPVNASLGDILCR
jgi:hypothetical protein